MNSNRSLKALRFDFCRFLKMLRTLKCFAKLVSRRSHVDVISFKGEAGVK